MTAVRLYLALTVLSSTANATASSTTKQYVEEFQFITSKIEDVYSHLDTKQIRYGFKYDQLKEKYTSAIAAAKDDSQYDALVKEFLASFHDGHLKIVPNVNEGISTNYEGELTPAVIHRWITSSTLLTSISRLWGNSSQIENALDRGLIEAARAKTLVVDLRGNSGGDDALAYRYISRLIAKDVPLGRIKIKMSEDVMKQRPNYAAMYQPDPKNEGWSAWRTLTMKSNTKNTFPGQIYVLIDKKCYSSCESAAQAFKNAGSAKLYGQTTGGGSANPIFLDLPTTKGRLMVPTWVQEMADGRPLEDNGVSPDVIVDASTDALDVVLAELGIRERKKATK